MTQATDVKLIDGTARTVRELFTGRKYGLDFYQREYTWTEANVNELLGDLSLAFLREFKLEDERQSVSNYRPYFLGPIVTSLVGGTRFLVDGQQRLTTVTLLLIHLQHLQEGGENTEDLRTLVYSQQYGKKTFNVAVKERDPVMHAILNNGDFDPAGASATVRNIWAMHQNIVEKFPDELKDGVLPYFVDWLLDRVILVEIGTTDQDMALEIFESMNDRGLRLSNTDMLKGYLLGRIGDAEGIEQSNQLWRKQITALNDQERNADSEFIKTWLRGKFAETARERKRDATPGDFDLIGTAFHKWVRDNNERLGLSASTDYQRFIEHDFRRMSDRYMKLIAASKSLIPGWEHVFYNATNGLTLQYMPIMAAVTPDDDEESFQRKTRLVAGYLDLFVARRMTNFRNLGYSTIVYTIFNLTKDVRNRSLDELREVLADKVADLPENFDDVSSYRLTLRNRTHVRYLLARMTSWIEEKSGTSSNFAEYVDRGRSNPYEVEHIWADKYERHLEEFDNPNDFSDYRNRFGGLLLLPKDFNASYGAKTYEEKLPHYHRQNVLAASLNPLTYENNPSLRRFIESSGVDLKPCPDDFSRKSLDMRQELYRELCERVWDPAAIGLAGGTPSSQTTSEKRRAFYGITVTHLLNANLLTPGESLVGARSGKEYSAQVLPDGRIRVADGREFYSLSGAADTLTDASNNGWEFWSVQRTSRAHQLAELRQEYLAHFADA